MRIGTMFNKKLVPLSSLKAATKDPTNMRKMVPGPRMAPPNKTACDGRRLSTYFVKTFRFFLAMFGINFSHKKNLEEVWVFNIRQQKTNQSVIQQQRLII
jgi:hypothetical protein